jgi:hypothetical protein
VAATATGSVGETMTPRTKATGHESPRARCAAAATAKVVSSTRPTASSPMGLRFSFRSRGEVKKADV